MFFHDKAWLKNEILERMNEKRNHLHSFAHFSRLFHNFPGFFTIFRYFSFRKSKKYTLQQLEHSWRWPRACYNTALTTTKQVFEKSRAQAKWISSIKVQRKNWKTYAYFLSGRFVVIAKVWIIVLCRSLARILLRIALGNYREVQISENKTLLLRMLTLWYSNASKIYTNSDIA